MAVERWDPFREAVSLRDAMNALFQDSFVRPSGSAAQGGVATLPLDVSENENEFLVKASLPGVKPEDVQITVHGETLTISGQSKYEEEKKDERWHIRERRAGSFQRSIVLPVPVDSDKAQAAFEHGVLTLTLPKSEQAKPRQIRIGGTGKR
jgi:HSP20 family protein